MMNSRRQDDRDERGTVVPFRQGPAGEAVAPLSALEAMNTHLRSQASLCQRLESIADSLPDSVDSQECLHVARSVYSIVRAAHDFEEKQLFPLLKSRFGGDERVSDALDRLHFEHWEDESYAEEVADGLSGFVTRRDQANPEALAYMLRGFFEGLRRHIAYEQDHLRPLVAAMEAGDDGHH